MSGEMADYACPSCDGLMVRDNTAAKRFRCRSCGRRVHEALVELGDDLGKLADRDDTIGEMAQALLPPEP